MVKTSSLNSIFERACMDGDMGTVRAVIEFLEGLAGDRFADRSGSVGLKSALSSGRFEVAGYLLDRLDYSYRDLEELFNCFCGYVVYNGGESNIRVCYFLIERCRGFSGYENVVHLNILFNNVCRCPEMVDFLVFFRGNGYNFGVYLNNRRKNVEGCSLEEMRIFKMRAFNERVDFCDRLGLVMGGGSKWKMEL